MHCLIDNILWSLYMCMDPLRTYSLQDKSHLYYVLCRLAQHDLTIIVENAYLVSINFSSWTIKLTKIELHPDQQRHIKSPIGTFSNPIVRFSHLHISIVWPVKTLHIYLKIIDQFFLWPTATPVWYISTKTNLRD